MQDWNPTCYLRFEAERTRPAEELAARINYPQAQTITDLGCGLGNSTAVLCKQHPKAAITGIDSCLDILDKSRTMLPGCQFEKGDIAHWQAPTKQDVIFANASLQWLDNHETLFPHLVTQLSSQGVLAVQMPDNQHAQSYRLMRDVAAELGYPCSHHHTILPVQTYYDLLSKAGCQVDIWRTTYFHILPSIQSMFDWLSHTALRRFIHHLSPTQQATYLEHYHALLKHVYRTQHDGNFIMPVPRLFIVAHKSLS